MCTKQQKEKTFMSVTIDETLGALTLYSNSITYPTEENIPENYRRPFLHVLYHHTYTTVTKTIYHMQ